MNAEPMELDLVTDEMERQEMELDFITDDMADDDGVEVDFILDSEEGREPCR
jgi:hypothetical protein